jgi:Zn-dependent peptidase ImmA (M78 family)/transcriptional regulator with XRE-family HTH domain
VTTATETEKTASKIIGAAVRHARETMRLTQHELARLVDLPAAQTVSQIENGEREVKAQEIVRIAEALHTDLDVLLGLRAAPEEPLVLWRRDGAPVNRSHEAQLLARARRYAQLEEWCEAPSRLSLPNYEFDPRTATRTDVAALAARAGRTFELGGIPAELLQPILETTYGVKVFTEPLAGGASGACVRAEFGAAVLLNSNESPSRRNYSLAHELFHLVTWDSVERAWYRDVPADGSEPHWFEQLEKFAQLFAAHILLPADAFRTQLYAKVDSGRIGYDTLVALARDFGVSTRALVVRMRDLNAITHGQKIALLDDEEFKRIDRQSVAHNWRVPKHWYPERYWDLLVRAYRRGIIGKPIVAQYVERPYAEVEALDLGEQRASEAAVTVA